MTQFQAFELGELSDDVYEGRPCIRSWQPPTAFSQRPSRATAFCFDRASASRRRPSPSAPWRRPAPASVPLRQNRRPRRRKGGACPRIEDLRSEEHTSELQSYSFISYDLFCF